MKISFNQKFRDVWAWQWHFNIRTPLPIIILLIFLALLWIDFFPTRQFSIIKLLYYLLTAIFLSSITYSIGFVFGMLCLISRKNKTLLGDKTIELTDSNIIVQNRYVRCEYIWEVVQKLSRSKNYIFIYIAHMNAYVIPRRAFATQQEWNDFYSLLKSHVNR